MKSDEGKTDAAEAKVEEKPNPPNGVLVLVELGEEGAEGVSAIQPLGDVRLSGVLTILKKATKLHEEQLGL